MITESTLTIATVDMAIFALIALSGIISVVRGFIKETMSIVIWLSAFFIAVSFKSVISDYLINVITLPSIRQMTAWGILFVSTLLIGSLLSFVLGKLVSSTGLSGTDKTLGLVFGVFRGFLIVLAIVIILPELVPVSSDQWWTESKLIPFFQSFESVGQELATLIINKITEWI